MSEAEESPRSKARMVEFGSSHQSIPESDGFWGEPNLKRLLQSCFGRDSKSGSTTPITRPESTPLPEATQAAQIDLSRLSLGSPSPQPRSNSLEESASPLKGLSPAERMVGSYAASSPVPLSKSKFKRSITNSSQASRPQRSQRSPISTSSSESESNLNKLEHESEGIGGQSNLRQNNSSLRASLERFHSTPTKHPRRLFPETTECATTLRSSSAKTLAAVPDSEDDTRALDKQSSIYKVPSI